MLLLFVFLIGMLSEYRILQKFYIQKIIHEHQFKILALICFISAAILAVILQKKVIFFWFLLTIGNLSLFLIPFVIQRRRKYEFEQQTIGLLDYIISSIKSGKSFRESIKSIQDFSEIKNYHHDEIFHAISLDQAPERISSDMQVQKLYADLKQIAKAQHRVSDRLQALRRILKTEKWFQQKTKQVLMQSRAQSVVMTLLYAGLICYLFLTEQLKGNSDLLLFSVGIFALGSIWIWKMGRSYKWKV